MGRWHDYSTRHDETKVHDFPLISGGDEGMKGQAPPAIEVSGKLKVLPLEGTPRNRGLIHGRTMREQIHELLHLWKIELARHSKIEADAFIKRFVSRSDYAAAVRIWTPELLEEIKGIAEGAGVDFDTMFVFQLADECYANGKTIAQDRCSSLGFSMRDQQAACIAQNMDIESYTDGFQLVLHIKHQDLDMESYVLTLAGCIGLNGMNNKAIGICCNMLPQLNNCRDGLPVACVVRGVLQQRTEDEAIGFLHRIKHASGQNYVLGGPTNVYSFECSAGQISRFKPSRREDVVWHTNHPLVNDDYISDYRALLERGTNLENVEPNTRNRLQALERRFTVDSVGWGVPFVKEALTSHDSVEYPVCRPKGQEYAFTFASTIMVLSEEPEFHVAPGPPDVTPYNKLSFSKKAQV